MNTVDKLKELNDNLELYTLSFQKRIMELNKEICRCYEIKRKHERY